MFLFLDALTVVWNNLYPYIDRSLNDLLKSTVALFVVIDPIGSVPLFIALTKGMKSSDRKRVSTSAIITAASLLIVFAVAGTQNPIYIWNNNFQFHDRRRGLTIHSFN